MFEACCRELFRVFDWRTCLDKGSALREDFRVALTEVFEVSVKV